MSYPLTPYPMKARTTVRAFSLYACETLGTEIQRMYSEAYLLNQGTAEQLHS